MKKPKINQNIYSNISKNIKKYRRKKGIKAEELAELVGISNSYMRQIESNDFKYHCSFETLYKISVVLELSIDTLIKK